MTRSSTRDDRDTADSDYVRCALLFFKNSLLTPCFSSILTLFCLQEVLQYNVIDRNKIKKHLRAQRALSAASDTVNGKVAQPAPTAQGRPPGPINDTPVTEADAPVEFLCPIMNELMDDPVFTCDGHTYSRQAIVQWFESCPGVFTSPNTGRCYCLCPDLRRWWLRKAEASHFHWFSLHRPVFAASLSGFSVWYFNRKPPNWTVCVLKALRCI